MRIATAPDTENDDTHRERTWTMLVAGVQHELAPKRLYATVKLLPHPGAMAGRYDTATYNYAAYGWSA